MSLTFAGHMGEQLKNRKALIGWGHKEASQTSPDCSDFKCKHHTWRGKKKLVCLFPNGRAVFVNERLPQLSPSHTPWIYNDLAVFSARRVVGPCQQPFNSDSHINVLIHRVLN